MDTEHTHQIEIKTKNKRQKLPKQTPKQPLPSDFHALRYQSTITLKPTDDRNHKRYLETDMHFVTDVHSIAENSRHLMKILEETKQCQLQIDDQECDQIHYRAKLHRKANIINTNSSMDFEKTLEGEKCNCGCKRSAGHPLSLCTQTNQLGTLGPGIILFCLFQKGMVINVLFAAVILGIFSTYSNLTAGTKPSLQDACIDSKCTFLNNSSAQNNTDLKLVQIEYILGVIFCLFWTVAVRFIRLYGRRLNKQVDSHLQTASDFAVQLSNLPFGEYSQKDLVEYLQSMWYKVSPQKPLNVRSIQVIYNFQFTRKMIEQIRVGCRKLSILLKKEDNDSYTIPADCYQEYKELKNGVIQNYQLLNDLRKKFLNDSEFRKKIATSCCLIEFERQEDKDVLLEKYGQLKTGILKRVQQRITGLCCPNNNNISFRGTVVDIQRAPQPSDLIWLNCQKRISIFKLMMIYVITCLIIALSFCALVGLYALGYYFQSQNNQYAATLVQIISIVTALALQVVNKVLWIVLQMILDIEYNYSLTLKIVSVMNKALFATCFNVLVLPMIVFVTMRSIPFGQNGLVGFVFNYHITTLTAGLILRLISPVDQVKRIIISLKPLRNWFLRKIRKAYSENQTANFEVYMFNFYEGEYFQVAQAYIFIIANIFHASFFCHLSPPLLFFVLIEVFVYFWINKYKLLRLIKIPELTEILVFDTALTHADLAPIIYGCGSLLIAYYQQKLYKYQVYDIKFPLIAIAIGIFSFSNPRNILNTLMNPVVECFFQGEKQVEDEQTSANVLAKQIESELQDEIHKEKHAKICRLQTYYKGSNSLKLLGYQKVLRGEDENLLSQELKSFCESFLRKKGHQQSYTQ